MKEKKNPARVWSVSGVRIFDVSKFANPVIHSPPQAVCSCKKYQIPAKFENKGTPPLNENLRSIARELKLGVKGRRKDDVFSKFSWGMPLNGPIYTGDGSSVEKDHPSSINTRRTMRRTIGVSCDSFCVYTGRVFFRQLLVTRWSFHG